MCGVIAGRTNPTLQGQQNGDMVFRVPGFHADNTEELIAAFQEAVDDYIETCAKIGKAPKKPYLGRLMFRVDPEVHAQAALAAKLKGQSLNAWAAGVLRYAAKATTGGAVAV